MTRESRDAMYRICWVHVVAILAVFIMGFVLVWAIGAWASDVSMAWDKEPVESDLAGFKVYSSTDPETGFSLLETIQDPTARTYKHVGVLEPTWWYVSAFDTSGNESGPSNIVDNTVPGPVVVRVTVIVE